MSNEYDIFKKKMKIIKKIKGRHTELISFFIPYGSDRSTITNQLTQEISQSSNIKSASTRKNVQSALRKIMQYIKVTDFNLPKNGVALYSGNISEIEGKTDIRIFHVVPPKSLNVKLYRCDSEFYTSPLDEMLEPDKIYGVVALDNKEATIANLTGKKYTIVTTLTSAVPGKIKAGGQSAARFERLRIDAANEFYSRISEKINAEYMQYVDKLEGIIIGGPGHSKKYMVERNEIDYRLRDKILGYVDVTYTDESGIKEIINNSEDILRENELIKEQKIIRHFFEIVAKNGNATYGFKQVLEETIKGRTNKIIISEEFVIDMESLDLKNFIVETVDNLIELDTFFEDEDVIELFIEIAKNFGTDVEVVSRETEEGEQFFRGFGGIGAILRY